MTLSVCRMAMACGILWAVTLLFVGVINRFYPTYGLPFLQVMDSIYPGYHAAFGMKNLIVGALYALLDGAVAGALLAWFYNMMSCKCCAPKEEKP